MTVFVTYLLALYITHVAVLASNEERELLIEASDHSCIHGTRPFNNNNNNNQSLISIL